MNKKLIIYFGVPFYGHLLPFLRLVPELRRNGYRVICINTIRLKEDILKAGAEFLPYPENAGLRQLDNPQRGFLELPEDMLLTVDCLYAWCERLLQRREPGLVFFDSIAPWGFFAAQSQKIATVCSQTFIGLTPEILERIGLVRSAWLRSRTGAAAFRTLEKIRRDFSIELEDPLEIILLQNRADRTIVYTSREFQIDERAFNAKFLFVGNRLDLKPQKRAANSEPSLLYISFGTRRINHSFFKNCITSLKDAPYRVCLSTGSTIDPEQLQPVPDNFSIRPFWNQIEILGQTKIFFSHGGMNSIMEALQCGVPMLFFPWANDQFLISEHARKFGIGEVVDKQNCDPETIRRAFLRMEANYGFYRDNCLAMAERLNRNRDIVGAIDQIKKLTVESYV